MQSKRLMYNQSFYTKIKLIKFDCGIRRIFKIVILIIIWYFFNKIYCSRYLFYCCFAVVDLFVWRVRIS
jgi:hypothetical protein